MESKEIVSQEKKVYLWGGLAGIIGGVILILSMVVAMGFMPAEPPTNAELVARFPNVLLLRVAENVLYLLGLIGGVLLVTALFWLLKKEALAPALFGSTLAIVGLVSMIVFATPHVAHNRVSGLYQASGNTPATQETLGLIWQTVWGITDTPLYIGFLVGMFGFTLLAIAMFKSSDFGKGISWVCFVVGAAGLIAAFTQMIIPGSDAGAISFFAYVIFNFVLGIKVYKSSKSA